MTDRKMFRSVLLLLLPVALLLGAVAALAGDTVRDVLFAVMKLAVIP